GSQLVLIGARAEPALDAARFPAADSELGAALAAVNLQTPASLLSTFCGARTWPRGERELCDDAPWIVFEEKPTDARVFDWLRVNLTRVEELAGDPSPAWVRTPGAEERIDVARLLLAARIEAAEEEATLRGLPATARRTESALDQLELRGKDTIGRLGVALLEERTYLALLRRGVASIERDPGRAADDLLSAAELRRERADVHLYVAAALARQGNADAARAAQARALELCPRVLDTPAGLRASKLGLLRP
ncbi:MAG TPA: hypothetical protein VM509_13955, partial [Planctomycetota bacterium]|nr:hypothetical protein [Planctomycetota bacterium]